MAVVKANAYGHGATLVAPVVAEGCDWLGVDSIDEAEEVAALELGKPILVLGHTEPEDAPRLVARGIRQVLFRRDVAQALSTAARELRKPATVHLKVETGLNRLGVPVEEVGAFVEWLRGLDGITLEGIYTHFADVEDPDSALVGVQVERLRDAVRAAGSPLLVHASPTAGALLGAASAMTLARIGIGLYGIWPSPATRDRTLAFPLRPVLFWKSRLAQVKSVPKGATVGYDLTYRAFSERRIGVVPVGYADGFDRKLSNRGEVLVRGRRAPVVGRVAMNMFMVDVTEVEARDGDEVVLIGEQGKESITADDMASAADTIAYEVLARLSSRLSRRIVKME
jgi:alanine racemase